MTVIERKWKLIGTAPRFEGAVNGIVIVYVSGAALAVGEEVYVVPAEELQGAVSFSERGRSLALACIDRYVGDLRRACKEDQGTPDGYPGTLGSDLQAELRDLRTIIGGRSTSVERDAARCQHCVPPPLADERSFMCEDCASKADEEVQALRDQIVGPVEALDEIAGLLDEALDQWTWPPTSAVFREWRERLSDAVKRGQERAA